jgi:O-antigen ligase
MPVFYGWPVDYLIIIPALLFAFSARSKANNKLVKIPQYKLLFVLLLIILLSNIVNGYIGNGIDEFIVLFKKICIFIIILLIANTNNKLKNTILFIVLISSFLSIQAIYQAITGGMGLAGQDFYHSGVGLRTTWVGLWNGANVFALLLNISVPFALEFAFGPYTQVTKIFGIIASASLLGGVYTTNSRGGFVTLLAILFIYPLFRIKKKKVAIFLGVALAIVAAIYLAPSRIGELSTQEESAHIRTRLWGNAIDMFKEHKLLGVGKGRFMEENGRHMMAHSNFMQNLGETGGIGIFVWVGLIYFSFKSLLYVYNMKMEGKSQDDQDKMKSLSRALLVSMIGFNICTLFVTMEIDIFYLLLGLCAACINIANREYKLIELKFTFKDLRNITGIIIIMLLYYHIYTR